jgi:dienelactone hydrolase
MEINQENTGGRRNVSVLVALATWIASALASAALAGPSEVFYGASGVTGLMHHPSESDGLRAAAVLIVHDTFGLDGRGQVYITQLTRAGLIVLEVEIAASVLEGVSEPIPGEIEAANLVARAAAALADDSRVDRRRVAALGFGLGARAVALAPDQMDGRHVFSARVLLYPGCGSLRDLVAASERRIPTIASPILLIHGEDEAANPSAACEALAAELGRTAPVQRISYEGAGYAWDLPQLSGGEYSGQPGPGDNRTIIVHPDPVLANLSAAQVTAFIVEYRPGDAREHRPEMRRR